MFFRRMRQVLVVGLVGWVLATAALVYVAPAPINLFIALLAVRAMIVVGMCVALAGLGVLALWGYADLPTEDRVALRWASKKLASATARQFRDHPKHGKTARVVEDLLEEEA